MMTRLQPLIALCIMLIARPGLLLAVPQPFLVLCYHSVQQSAGSPYTTSYEQFTSQMEYLAHHNYHPVSLDAILKAAKENRPLPEKPVLLTFDDGYRSYRDFVLPVLKEYGYPSLLAIVGNWISNPPPDLPEPLLTWDDLRRLESENLVELVSHSFNLHRSVSYTPQGNVGSVVSVRKYLPQAGRYENSDQYRSLLEEDFARQKKLFREQLGKDPRAIVWPYGRYNEIAIEVAKAAGCKICLTLDDGYADTGHLDRIRRLSIGNGSMEEFISSIGHPDGPVPLIRAMQVGLDQIYVPDSADKTDRNLGRLIDRLVQLGVNTVFLQAFADPDRDGTADAVYFATDVLPVRADIFGHCVHQMSIRDLNVYAWMPILSYRLPRGGTNVLAGRQRQQKSQPRLFLSRPEVRQAIKKLYQDLATHTQISGILFQDDAAMGGSEKFKETTAWANTNLLTDFTQTLAEEVRRFRPGARFARNILAPPLFQPGAGHWFSRTYQLFLDRYDLVVLMAYPQLNRAEEPLAWLRGLVRETRNYPLGPAKTVFKIQAYDWRTSKWISNALLLDELRTILAQGGRHLAYYPDNLYENRPEIKTLKLELSTRSFPRE